MSLFGFMRLCGSQIALNSRNACISSGPYMIGRNSAFAWPSPCSPESEPPYFTTSAAAAARKRRQCAMPAVLFRSKSMRACTQPSPKWP